MSASLRPYTLPLFALALLPLVLVSACSIFQRFSDPWASCPEERQCLSGDIVSNDAKACCADGEVCYVSDPMEGGTCLAAEEAEARRAERQRSQPPQPLQDTAPPTDATAP